MSRRARNLSITCLVLLFLVTIGTTWYISSHKKVATTNSTASATKAQPQATTQSNSAPATKAEPAPQYSTTDPASIWIIANKKHPLPSGYQPSDLSRPDIAVNSQKSDEENTVRQVIQPSLKAMFAAAKADGIDLIMASGYRSPSLQATYYNSYVARDGVDAANRYSAKPGTSEHQTGLALDIAASSRNCYLDQCFATTPEGKWLATNAHTYGFVLRYPDGKESETGYTYEPWHFRYVGNELAKTVTDKQETLEAHFGLL
jgi:D-alanyl-D-alanine carboxypeptidase